LDKSTLYAQAQTEACRESLKQLNLQAITKPLDCRYFCNQPGIGVNAICGPEETDTKRNNWSFNSLLSARPYQPFLYGIRLDAKVTSTSLTT
jgi:hypothetical protein